MFIHDRATLLNSSNKIKIFTIQMSTHLHVNKPATTRDLSGAGNPAQTTS